MSWKVLSELNPEIAGEATDIINGGENVLLKMSL